MLLDRSVSKVKCDQRITVLLEALPKLPYGIVDECHTVSGCFLTNPWYIEPSLDMIRLPTHQFGWNVRDQRRHWEKW